MTLQINGIKRVLAAGLGSFCIGEGGGSRRSSVGGRACVHASPASASPVPVRFGRSVPPQKWWSACRLQRGERREERYGDTMYNLESRPRFQFELLILICTSALKHSSKLADAAQYCTMVRSSVEYLPYPQCRLMWGFLAGLCLFSLSRLWLAGKNFFFFLPFLSHCLLCVMCVIPKVPQHGLCISRSAIGQSRRRF